MPISGERATAMTASAAIGAPRTGSIDDGDGSGPGLGAGHFCQSGTIRWHFHRSSRAMRAAPRLLLLHGTGSAGGSWRRLTASLGATFDILAPDLPGHGHTGELPPGRCGPADYAAAVHGLVADLGAWPDLIVGHSAGAAIAAGMALDTNADRVAVLSINGALRPLHGWTAAAFVPLAKVLGIHPLATGLVASLVRADARAVRRLLDATGSRIDAGMVGYYEQLLRVPGHVAGTLRMLARWDLRPLLPQLHRLGPRLTLVAGGRDRTIAPQDAEWVQQRVPGSMKIGLAALGHLAHEEAPASIARIVVAAARARGLLQDAPLAAEPDR